MKGKKCFGLLSLLAIMLGLSLSVSSDTNALKYQIEKIPFLTAPYYTNLTFTFNNQTETNYLPDISDIYRGYYVKLSYGDWLGNPGCMYQSWDRIGKISDNYVFWSSGNTRVAPSFLSDSYSSVNYTPQTVVCSRNSAISHPFYNLPPYVFGTPDLFSLHPYWFSVDGLYAQFNGKNDDGIVLHNRLNFMELFPGVDSLPGLYAIDIPIGGVNPLIGDISQGDTFEVIGKFYFDSDHPDIDVLTLDPNFTIQLSGEEFETGSPNTINCFYQLFDNRSDTTIAPYELAFTCQYTHNRNTEAGKLGFTLHFSTGSSGTNSFLFGNYPFSDFVLEDFYVITNGDSTPSDYAFSGNVSGNFKDDTPGSGFVDIHDDSLDWVSSLTSLFSFNVFNPFEPIFGMFTNNSSCASIPIIAGMLGSSETTYCPWFSSDVRNILTPVLGLSAIMLLFGFVVRWLGSSSGNLFEDSTNESVAPPGHFSGWGRRRK